MAAGAFNHPEEAHPDNLPPLTTPGGPYDDYIKEVQRKLHEHGFDAGPINGDFGLKTQTALGQFQISQTLPASGALDDATLKALEMQRPVQEAAAGQQAAQGGSEARKPAAGGE